MLQSGGMSSFHFFHFLIADFPSMADFKTWKKKEKKENMDGKHLLTPKSCYSRPGGGQEEGVEQQKGGGTSLIYEIPPPA